MLSPHSSMTAALASSIRLLIYFFIWSFLLSGAFTGRLFFERLFLCCFSSVETSVTHLQIQIQSQYCLLVFSLADISPCLSVLSSLCFWKKDVYDVCSGRKARRLRLFSVFSSRRLVSTLILFFSVFFFSFLKKSGISTSLLSHRPWHWTHKHTSCHDQHASDIKTWRASFDYYKRIPQHHRRL